METGDQKRNNRKLVWWHSNEEAKEGEQEWHTENLIAGKREDSMRMPVRCSF